MTPDSTVEELAKTIARFRKAQQMADILEGEGVSYQAARYMMDREWDLVVHAARLESASIVTRQMTLELLRDREERKQRG